jgi:large subunit ribosomal protein L29
MAKKEKRLEEFRGKPDDELRKELDTLVTGLFNLRFRKVTDVVENPAAFRKHRVEIAQIKTILRERELKTAKK